MSHLACSSWWDGRPEDRRWEFPDDPHHQTPKNWNDVCNQLRWPLLGWLLAALAISLGAPFWFNVLNRVLAVRSTLKPTSRASVTESTPVQGELVDTTPSTKAVTKRTAATTDDEAHGAPERGEAP